MCRSVSSATVMEVLLAGCTTVVPSGRYDPAILGTVVRRRTNAHRATRGGGGGRRWRLGDHFESCGLDTTMPVNICGLYPPGVNKYPLLLVSGSLGLRSDTSAAPYLPRV